MGNIGQLLGNNEKKAQNIHIHAVKALEEIAHKKGLYVCIIDDDLASINFLEEFLKHKGCTVFSYLSSKDLFLELQSEDTTKTILNECDLLLVDLKMPQIDGMTLSEQIKSKYPHLPIVLISAYASIETAVGAIKTGFYDLLEKPISLERLSKIIDSILLQKK